MEKEGSQKINHVISALHQVKDQSERKWQYQIRVVSEPAPILQFITRKPTGMYQGMVAPCLNMTVRSVLWYQGESNEGNPELYEDILKNDLRLEKTLETGKTAIYSDTTSSMQYRYQRRWCLGCYPSGSETGSGTARGGDDCKS